MSRLSKKRVVGKSRRSERKRIMDGEGDERGVLNIYTNVL